MIFTLTITSIFFPYINIKKDLFIPLRRQLKNKIRQIYITRYHYTLQWKRVPGAGHPTWSHRLQCQSSPVAGFVDNSTCTTYLFPVGATSERAGGWPGCTCRRSWRGPTMNPPSLLPHLLPPPPVCPSRISTKNPRYDTKLGPYLNRPKAPNMMEGINGDGPLSFAIVRSPKLFI